MSPGALLEETGQTPDPVNYQDRAMPDVSPEASEWGLEGKACLYGLPSPRKLVPAVATPWPGASGFCSLDTGARVTDTCYHACSFCLPPGDLNLGPQACTAGALPTKPFSSLEAVLKDSISGQPGCRAMPGTHWVPGSSSRVALKREQQCSLERLQS